MTVILSDLPAKRPAPPAVATFSDPFDERLLKYIRDQCDGSTRIWSAIHRVVDEGHTACRTERRVQISRALKRLRSLLHNGVLERHGKDCIRVKLLIEEVPAEPVIRHKNLPPAVGPTEARNCVFNVGGPSPGIITTKLLNC